MTFHSINPYETRVGQQIRFRPIQGEFPQEYRAVFEVVRECGDEKGHRILSLNGRLVEFSPSKNRLGRVPLPWGMIVEAKDG